MILPVEQALALSELRRKEWLLLGVSALGPCYTCPRCYGYRMTIVTAGAELPDACPKCRAELADPVAKFS